MDKITYAYLETTNYCNLDCSFCNRDEGDWTTKTYVVRGLG